MRIGIFLEDVIQHKIPGKKNANASEFIHTD